MNPDDRKYTKTHEWVKVDDGIATVGLTNYAQDSLGDITFVELPETDSAVSQGGECCVVESVKAASDFYAPVSGSIADVNSELEETPEVINSSPYEEGWIFKIKDFNASDLDSLMNASEYEKFLETSK